MCSVCVHAACGMPHVPHKKVFRRFSRIAPKCRCVTHRACPDCVLLDAGEIDRFGADTQALCAVAKHVFECFEGAEEVETGSEGGTASMFLKARSPDRMWFLVRTQCAPHETVYSPAVHCTTDMHVNEAEAPSWQSRRGCHRDGIDACRHDSYIRQPSKDRQRACSSTYGRNAQWRS